MSVSGADCYYAYMVVDDYQEREISLDLQSKAVKYLYQTSSS
jgi:hypothetical protein